MAWGDYDNDGNLDVYMASGSGQDRLYWNRGDGTFENATTSGGVSGGLNNAEWVDFDNDGWLDLYLSNIQVFDAEGNPDMASSIPSRLYRNRGDGAFTDVAASAGVAEYGNVGVWGDYDDDGDLDLYLAGSIYYTNPTRLYRNNGDGTFRDVADRAGVADLGEDQAIGAAWGDYDNDGFLDLYVCNAHLIDGAPVGAPNLLFHNQGNGNHWLVAQLRGTASNRDAIGARVIAVTGKTRQRRDVENAGPGWGSQPSLPVEFGLGRATMVDSLLIRWPSGIEQALTRVAADQYLVLEESGGREPTAVAEETEALPGSFLLGQNYPNPCNGETAIHFEVPTGGEVELGVYDLAGSGWRYWCRGSGRPGVTRCAGTDVMSGEEGWPAGCTCIGCGPGVRPRPALCGCCAESGGSAQQPRHYEPGARLSEPFRLPE